MVFDEAKHSELIHEKVNARACSADHRCQGPLRDSSKLVLPAVIPLVCEQQKSAGEPPLAALRNLIDQILLDPNVARKQVRKEGVGELTVSVERSEHLVSFNDL
jgi:hypothetical protein